MGLAGKAGKIFAKMLLDANGKGPVPFWGAPALSKDNRLVPDRADRGVYVFAEKSSLVRVRLIYNRFWNDVARQKAWPHEGITLVDQFLP
jgi:hypothetical protein